MHLATSLRCFEEGESRLEAARTHVVWGRHCRERGDTSGAQVHLEKAAAQFEASGLTEELYRTRSALQDLPATDLSQVPPKTRREAHRYPASLTAREVEVLRLIAAGRTNKEIAEELVLSLATVERHNFNIYVKIGARGRGEAIAFALQHGLVRDRDR